MSNSAKKAEEEILQKAQAHAEEQISQLREEREQRKKKLIKFGSLTTLAVLVLIFSSIAWFTMSRETSGSGARAQAPDLPFDIATKGTNIRNKTIIESGTDYKEGSSTVLEDESGESGNYNTGDSIMLRFDPAQEDNPETLDIDESIPPDISPGRSPAPVRTAYAKSRFQMPAHFFALDGYSS